MMFQGLQILSGLALLVSFVSGTVVVLNATYDDLTFTPVDESAIGTYKNLIYNAWVVSGPLTPGVAVGSVGAKSPPNDALTSEDLQLKNGTASFSIAKPYKSFSLLDFYFGCNVRTDEGTVGVATQCTITVAGFQATSDKEIALASFTFTPPSASVPPTQVSMIHAVLPVDFLQPLYNVTVAQSNALAALKIDNLHYSVST